MATKRAVAFVRTLAQANQLLCEEGARRWINATAERLGSYREDHERWLRTCSEKSLRAWARSVSKRSRSLNNSDDDAPHTYQQYWKLLFKEEDAKAVVASGGVPQTVEEIDDWLSEAEAETHQDVQADKELRRAMNDPDYLFDDCGDWHDRAVAELHAAVSRKEAPKRPEKKSANSRKGSGKG